MKTHEIREARASKVAEMRSLTQGEMTAEKKTRFDALKAEVVALEEDERRALFLEEAERRAMGSTTGDHAAAELSERINVLDVIRAQMEGRSLSGAAAEFHQEAERRSGRKAQGVMIPLAALETRINTAGGSGGKLIGTDQRPDEYIGPFRNALLARRLGTRVLPGLVGNVSIPKYSAGLTSAWVAEGSALSQSDLTFDNPVTLTPKHVGALSEMSRQLIQQSAPAIEELVRDDIAFQLAAAIDTALFHGTGVSPYPKGVLATTGIQTASLATLSWQNVLALLQKLDLQNATAANIVASTKVKAKLAGTVKATGTAVYLMEGNRMADLPCYFTNQLQEKSGSPSTGRLIAGDWSQAMLGIWSEIDLLVNPYESTAYAKGNVQIRAMATCDIGVRHPEAFVVADDVAI